MAEHIFDKFKFNNGDIYKVKDNVSGYTTNTGTVTSVRVQATSPVQSSTDTAQPSTLDTTISLADAYGDTKNPYGTKEANYVLAGPSSGTASAPTFRALATSDIPDLSGEYLPLTGGSVTGDITLKSDAATNSKSVIFQRGTLTDNYNDWQIQDRGGFLYFDQRGSNSSSFSNQVCFNTSGNVQATTFNGYYLQPATYSTASLIKPWFSTTGASTLASGSSQAYSDNPSINGRTTTAGRYYALEIDKNGRGYVNVPWESGSSGPQLFTGNTSSVTPNQVLTAIQNNQNIYITHDINMDLSIVATYFDYAPSMFMMISNIIAYYQNQYWLYTLIGNTYDDTWSVSSTSIAQTSDIPSVPTGADNNTTGISIADHSTTTIYGVTSSTTSVTGVQSSTTSVRGVKTGTNSTTTASKVTLGTNITVRGVKTGTSSTTTASHVKSGGNGSAPTLGTAITVRGVKTGTGSTTTASHVKSGGNGTAPTLGTAISLTGVQATTTSVRGVKTGTNSLATASHVTSGGNGSAPTLGTAITVRGVKTGTNSTTTASKVTIGTSTTLFGVSSSTTTASKVTTGTSTTLFGVGSSTTTASKVTTGSHSTDYGVSNAGSGSFTQGTFNGGSFSATVTNHVLSYNFTAATHGADSHTHTAPTLGDKVPTVSASDVTVPIKSTGVTTVSASDVTVPIQSTGITTVSASDVTVPIRADADTTIPNVTSVGSASTWAFSDVDVPIRADSDTTVPIKDTNATSIPNVTSAGSASNWAFEDITVPIRNDADTSIPNVTSAGSASNWVFEDITVPIRADDDTTIPNVTGATDVTVPIRADADTTVPIKDASSTTVPIKDSGTTVVTSKTHTVTDTGHTHTLS